MCNYVISSEHSKRTFKTLEFVTPGLLHSISLSPRGEKSYVSGDAMVSWSSETATKELEDSTLG